VPIIATAGHVDHGKSTLVLALTGIDPDRLEEEKRRGLTIDLGFAFFTTPGGRQVGIIDVPGHEKFIKNMLAGVGAIDLNLFVVAANEGWKPQSQEHLDIMDLLGVRTAIVVITKVDIASREQIEAVREQVAERLRGTSLEGAPVLEVSAVARTGLQELIEQIDLALDRSMGPRERRRTRMWIDRSFTIKGSGTVVTGTLAGGPLRIGQEVEILPAGRRARIRTIQSHNQDVAQVEPGTRTALNLGGVERTTVKRGDALTVPNQWRTTDKVLASVAFLDNDFEPRAGTGYKFHVGSIEIEAAVRFVGEKPRAGGSADALLSLDEATTLEFEDRFILRDSGRHQTVGGGVVLEAQPEHLGRSPKVLSTAAAARRGAADRAAYLGILLSELGYLTFEEVLIRTGLSREEVAQEGVLYLQDYLMSQQWFEETSSHIERQLRKYQAAHPVDAGMPLTELRRELRLQDVLNVLLDELERRGSVVADSTAVRTSDFTPQTVGPEQQRLLDQVRRAGASPPTIAELNSEHGAPLVRALIRNGDLVQVNPFVFSTEFMEELKKLVVKRVAEAGPFAVADFRDLVGTTRKYAVPLLEYLDQVGFTARRGDLRVLGPKSGVAS
jgi:selenocysteine-specific elongation factor